MNWPTTLPYPSDGWPTWLALVVRVIEALESSNVEVAGKAFNWLVGGGVEVAEPSARDAVARFSGCCLWDVYWLYQWLAFPFDHWDSDETHLVTIDERRERWLPAAHTLIVGNGRSALGHELAHFGSNVTALDISRLATASVAAMARFGDPTRFFDACPGSSDRETTRPVGRCKAVAGDVLDPLVAPGPFDVIWMNRVIHCLWLDGSIQHSIAAMASRLTESGGIRISHPDRLNRAGRRESWPPHDGLRELLLDAGLVERDPGEPPPGCRHFMLWVTRY